MRPHRPLRLALGLVLALLAFGSQSSSAETEPAATPDALQQQLQALQTQLIEAYQAGRFEQAAQVAEATLRLAEAELGPEHPTTLASLGNLASVLNSLGRYAEAEVLQRQALAAKERVLGPDHPDTLGTRNNLGLVLMRLAKYEEAAAVLRQALAAFDRVLGPDHPHTLSSLNNLASVLEALSRYEESETLQRQALERRLRVLGPDDPGTLLTLNNLARLVNDLGRYEEAEALQRQALAGQERVLGPDHPDTLLSRYNLALVFDNLGRGEEAEALHRQALAGRERVLGPEHPDTLASLNNLALVLDHQGRREEAAALHQRALAAFERVLGPEHLRTLTSRLNLASVLGNLGRGEEAEALLRQALVDHERALGPDHPITLAAVHNLAGLLTAIGQLNEAEPLYRRAVETRERVLGPQHPDTLASRAGLAELLAAGGQDDDALTQFDRALAGQQLNLRRIFPTLTEPRKHQYLATLERIDGLLTLVARHRAEPAYLTAGLNWTFRRKGLVLDALLADRQRLRLAADPATAAAQQALRAAQSRLARLAFEHDEADPETYRQHYAAAQTEVEAQRQALAERSAAVRAQAAVEEATASAVAEALPAGSALVEFVRFAPFDFQTRAWLEPVYIAFVLRAGQPLPAFVPLGLAAPLEALAARFSQRIGRNLPRPEQAGVPLYEALWAPLATHLVEVDRVYLAPDGQLNLLAFGALPTPDGGFLAERHVLAYLGSGRELLRPATDRPVARLIAFADPAFGELGIGEATMAPLRSVVSSAEVDLVRQALTPVLAPLPGTRREAEQLAALAQNQGLAVQTLLDEQATEARLKALGSAGEVAAPDILHVATHGFFLPDVAWSNPAAGDGGEGGGRFVYVPQRGGVGEPTPAGALPLGNPMHRSGLMLAGAQRLLDGEPMPATGEDGILTAAEVATLDLAGTQLVALSACQTGLGQVQAGEGVYGLRRAFQLAGADSLLMSLWKVPDDATADLMAAFYRRYLAGDDAAAALTGAQREALAQARAAGEATHPFHWAAFVAGGAR